MKKSTVALALLSLATLPAPSFAEKALSPASGARGAPSRIAATQVRPRVEVAFVLDTTGSMGGLLEGAKRRIWSVARRMGEGRPRPDLRIALVAYRDRGDLYVTQVHDFTSDMDAVYARLMSFQADGGGDTPEHVSAALEAAVHRLQWSANGMRVAFLVGDAPPHLDYQDGFDYRRHAREAVQRGIVVEAIECGTDPTTARVWTEIASLAQGHFARIDSNGGMPARVTPADAELARLNGELARTVVSYGSRDEQATAARKISGRMAMPAPAAAEAASYFAKTE
ncbi:MAG TPA: vWA domain-containing protein, partial [Vicinamibacteria bacterium]